LTKSDIIKQVRNLGYAKEDSVKIVETLLEVIKFRLADGEDVLVSGFGKFYVMDKAPTRGRNPATGDDLMLDARRVVAFKCSGSCGGGLIKNPKEVVSWALKAW